LEGDAERVCRIGVAVGGDEIGFAQTQEPLADARGSESANNCGWQRNRESERARAHEWQMI
jgi:hypothetical protein